MTFLYSTATKSLEVLIYSSHLILQDFVKAMTSERRRCRRKQTQDTHTDCRCLAHVRHRCGAGRLFNEQVAELVTTMTGFVRLRRVAISR